MLATAGRVTAAHTLGSYRLIAELGHGGMADVFLAAAEGPLGSGFTKLAVVKKLRSHLAEDPEFVEMLMDEARLTARLSHPNVVQLFEVGHAGQDYFLAIEFLEGQPLHRVERRVTRSYAGLPRDIYCSVVSDVLAGLHHAHELADYDGKPLNVVHRDVTPHNVFVTYDGTVKVLDFGIAKAAGRRCETQLGTVKGKVRYMSPEQARGGDVDRRTDIFATGVILWNLATGTSFWSERNDVEIAQMLHEGAYDSSPRSRCPEVPDAIDAICRKALAFRPEDRYATAEEMRTDLEAFLGSGTMDARKKRAAMMQELFVKDRAKLRAVLETSGLMAAPSFEKLSATLGNVPRTQTPPSERRPSTPVAAHRSVPPVNRSMRPEPPRRETKLAAVVRSVAIAGSAAILLAATVVALTSDRSRARHATPAVVGTDLTTASLDVRGKAEPSAEPVNLRKAAQVVHRTTASGHAAHGENASSSVARPPADVPPASSEAAKATRKRSPLDTADPWGSAGDRGR